MRYAEDTRVVAAAARLDDGLQREEDESNVGGEEQDRDDEECNGCAGPSVGVARENHVLSVSGSLQPSRGLALREGQPYKAS